MTTIMMKLNILGTALSAILGAGAVIHAQPTEPTGQVAKPVIVIVHVQNPTTSLADDVSAAERVIKRQTGPVVLFGHSWAGVVITQAGNSSKVKALVYVVASAPDSGQSFTDAAGGNQGSHHRNEEMRLRRLGLATARIEGNHDGA